MSESKQTALCCRVEGLCMVGLGSAQFYRAFAVFGLCKL